MSIETIEISQETYTRLQRLAVAFKDTPDTVITRLLNESEQKAAGPRQPVSSQGKSGAEGRSPPTIGGNFGSTDIPIENALNPPSLKHTKVLRAEVNGQQLAKANWTNVRGTLVETALSQPRFDLRRLLEVCPINAVEGVKSNEGYTPHRTLGVSIQGQDANHAWQAAAALAMALRIPVRVWFQWRAKPAAAHPGKRSLLEIG